MALAAWLAFEHWRGDMLDISVAARADLSDRDENPSMCMDARRSPSPLRICFITETLHAGVGRHIVDAASELACRGHKIHLIYSPSRFEPRFLAHLTGLANIHCEPVPMPRNIGFADIAAFAAIKGYVRKNGPFDIVHGHSSNGGGYARLLRFSGTHKILYSPHAFVTLSPVPGREKRLAFRAIEWLLARLTDCIICTSRGELEHALDLQIHRKRLALIANGGSPAAAPSREATRAKLGIAPDQIVVGFAGRMEDQKAPQHLIASVLPLLQAVPRLTLLMIGEGPKRALLEAQLERAGLAQRAIWPGAVNATSYMPAMDLFVLPSVYEGFAYVLIEALYAGLPIVATPVGGSQESVISGVNGFVVPQGARAEMADAIRTLATDDELRRWMGEASRARAEYFSVPRMVDSIEGSYFRLLARRERAGSAPLRGFRTGTQAGSVGESAQP
ncbi:MAG TPA: glycosyltransferase [Micropepsaceae bacterium]|nr:glycosyltransferase [Micropepsaceae bacterium]